MPLMAMYIVRKQRGKQVDGVMSKPIAYMLWLCGGFAGLHRLYVKNAWGLVYIPIFIALLLFNVQVRKAVDAVSGAKNEVSIAEFDVERAQKAIDKGRDGAQQKMDKAKQAMATAQQNLAENRSQPCEMVPVHEYRGHHHCGIFADRCLFAARHA